VICLQSALCVAGQEGMVRFREMNSNATPAGKPPPVFGLLT